MTRKEYIESPDLQLQESLLLKLFERNDAITIFDIGACEGESSVRYARLFPQASIFTFEPLPANFERIKKNIAEYKTSKVQPQQLCLSDKKGETEFYVSSGQPGAAANEDWDYGNKSSSLLAPSKTKEVHAWLKFENKVTVQTDTLDNFCAANAVPVIDFIHMDVQGAELMVLNGAKQMLDHINGIWLEVEAVELYEGQPLKNDIEKFMRSHGFLKLADTVYDTAGDQFWLREKFVQKKNMGSKVVFLRFTDTLRFIYKKIRRKFF